MICLALRSSRGCERLAAPPVVRVGVRPRGLGCRLRARGALLFGLPPERGSQRALSRTSIARAWTAHIPVRAERRRRVRKPAGAASGRRAGAEQRDTAE